MLLLQDPVLLQALKLFLALSFGILFTPFILLAFFYLLLALISLFPAYFAFFFALLLLKFLFKGSSETDEQGLKEEQVSMELDSSEFSFSSFGFHDSEDSKAKTSETDHRLNKHLELWHNWHPDSVETPHRKPFHELLSFWRRLEKPEVKQKHHKS